MELLVYLLLAGKLWAQHLPVNLWGNLLSSGMFRFWNIRDRSIRVEGKGVNEVSPTTYRPGATRNDLIRGDSHEEF
jgi:hypothetical protein